VIDYQTLGVVAGFLFLYSVIASRLERTPINGALVYMTFGVVCGPVGFGIIDLNVDGEGLSTLAELTLALVLFTDSANADLTVLRRTSQIPLRLLLIGLPMTIVLGIGVGMLVFDGLGFFEVALLATMLAPTDAALGKAVVTNAAVPAPVREGLNVESGLNDGICVPVILIFLALAAGDVSGSEAAGLARWLPVEAIGVGVVVGAVFAIVGERVLKLFAQWKWVTETWVQVPVVALAMLCFACAQALGGSGFIAAFVGGLVFGGLARNNKEKEHVLRPAEGAGDTFALVTWVVFGAAVVGQHIDKLSWQVIVYAISSLTVIRIVPVMVCLGGLGMGMDSKLFIGWFGPRGLASIVFLVMALDKELAGNDILLEAVLATVVLSIIAHGLSANPAARAYAARLSRSASGGSVAA